MSLNFKITMCKLLRAERSTYEGLACVNILCQGVYSFKEIKGQYTDRAVVENESTLLNGFLLLPSWDKF